MHVCVVAGGRAPSPGLVAALNRALNALQPTQVWQGGAPGIDEEALRWCRRQPRGLVTYRVFTADWAGYGKAAGPRRTAAMLAEAAAAVREGTRVTVVVATGGAGSRFALRRARQLGLRVVHVAEALPG